jgi:hypothetical protein
MHRYRAAFALTALALLITASPAASALSLEDLRDPEDGRFDTSRMLLDLKGFLPVPIIVTEPAIGYGAGAALLFFDRNAPPEASERAGRRSTPPDVSAVGGFGTENGSRGAFAGHLGFTRDGRWRYAAGVAHASLNLTFFGARASDAGDEARGLAYNLETTAAIADVRHRLGDSDWFAGLRYLRADTDSRFDLGRPASIPAHQLRSTEAGLAAVAEYDGRDNIFTPTRGTRISLMANDFGASWGGDHEFRLYRAAANSFWDAVPKLVLGARLDYRSSTGDPPFYARPFIELRGIPALRYQGDHVAVAELEARWNLDGRWSLIGFAGAGQAAGRAGDFGTVPTRSTVGVGLRYLLARALGLHAGVDVARGPEESAIYLIVGSAWR